MQSQRPFLIVSVYLSSENEETNKSNHKAVLQRLEQLQVPHIELQGKYKGIDELSILIDSFDHRALVQNLAKEFSQESYLESNDDGSTYLAYADNTLEYIGQFENVPKNHAEAYSSYSYNPKSDQYFITRLSWHIRQPKGVK